MRPRSVSSSRRAGTPSPSLPCSSGRARDPDKDTLVYDAAYSSDGGKTWTLISKKATPDGAKSKSTAAASQANLDKQTNMPPAIRARIQAQNQGRGGPPRRLQRQVAATGATGLKETSFSWDTTEVPDGTYQVRVTASDKPSNPTGASDRQGGLGPLPGGERRPRTLTLGTPAVAADKTVTLRGTVTTGLAFAKAVQARVDGGDAQAAAAGRRAVRLVFGAVHLDAVPVFFR